MIIEIDFTFKLQNLFYVKNWIYTNLQGGIKKFSNLLCLKEN